MRLRDLDRVQLVPQRSTHPDQQIVRVRELVSHN